MQYFTAQLRHAQETTHSLRANQYRKKRKTKPDEEEDEPSTSPQPEGKARSNSRTQSYASLASPELAQLRVAGLLPEDEYAVPPAPFPHASARVSRQHYGSAKVQEEMACSPSRLYAVNAASKSDSVDGRKDTNTLKRTHLNILSTVMHRCLLEGDYERAGRAWGMILRTQVVGGHPVDPRNHGRWGIGAEILLHHKPQTPPSQNQQPRNTESLDFSEEGFERAREYYERLIVQHPYRRTHPHLLDERVFYPAMFSLWILEICEKSKQARKEVHSKAANQSRSSRSTSIDSTSGFDTDGLRAQEDAIQVEELARAMELAERLDRLIVSPPFDKQASLLQLRGNVALWISDLVTGKTALDEDWDMDPSIQDSDESTGSVADQLTRLTNGHRELQQAQSFFKRAEVNGAQRQAATMSSIDIKLKELARQFERLRAPRENNFSSFLTSNHHMPGSLFSHLR